ncbi:MAG: TRAP transporter small permease [Acidobacteria bacterium]|nr:TRAP transporter small permease [Acidobacteriota bacterium]
MSAWRASRAMMQEDRRGPWTARYAAFEDIASGLCLAAGMTLILYGVVMRYVFSTPLYWVDEISTYLTVWGALLGWSVAERDRRHIRVTLLFDRLPPPVRRATALVASLVSAGFCFFLAYMAWVLETRYVTSGQRTLNTQSPLWIVYSVVPLAALMLGGRYAAESLDLLRGGATQDPDAPAPDAAVSS